jgi:hypothetical protein
VEEGPGVLNLGVLALVLHGWRGVDTRPCMQTAWFAARVEADTAQLGPIDDYSSRVKGNSHHSTLCMFHQMAGRHEAADPHTMK